MVSMISEIVEALEQYYNKDEEAYVECLLFLLKLCTETDTKCDSIYNAFEDMERCCDCGNKLIPYTYEERHTELFGSPIEYITELVCPNCDVY